MLTKSVEPVELAQKNLGNAVGWLMLCVMFLVIGLTVAVVTAAHFFNRAEDLQRALDQERYTNPPGECGAGTIDDLPHPCSAHDALRECENHLDDIATQLMSCSSGFDALAKQRDALSR